MKKNNFLKHFTIIGMGTFFNLILGLITTPFITRMVDPIEYGQLSIFTMYSNIAVMVLCLGLDQAIVRYYYNSKKVEYKRKLLYMCIWCPVLISIILGIGIVLLSVFDIFKFEFSSFIMVMLAIYTIIQIIYRFSLLIVRLEYKSKIYSFLNILQKLLYICLAIPLLFIFNKNYLEILVCSTVISAFICLIVSIVFQFNIWNYFKSRQDNEVNIKFKELIKYAYPFIFSMGVTTLFQAIDKISLNYFCTYTEVGIYSSAMSLVHIFAVIQSTFNTLWSPMAVEHYTKNKKDKEFYVKGNKIITFVMFFLGLSLILFKDVFAVLLGEKYREAAYILPFLIFNPIMYTISETTVSGLVFMKKSKMQVLVAIGACLSNLIGNFILVPILGGKGAAISTGIAYIVFFSLRTIFSNKYYYIDFKLKRFYLLTFITSLYALYNTFVKFNMFSILGYICCIIILCILYFDSLKFLIEYIKKMLQKIRGRKDVTKNIVKD